MFKIKRNDWLLAIIAVLSIAVFAVILSELRTGIFYGIDKATAVLFQSANFGFLTIIARVFDFIFDWKALLIITILMSAFLFYRDKKKRDATILSLFMLANIAFLLLFKYLVSRERPLGSLISETVTTSFPSGHAAISVLFIGLMMYYSWNYFKNTRAKYLVVLGLPLMMFFVGLSRLYLNVHWFSDVIAGFALGAFWLFTAIFFERTFRK